MPNIMKIMRRNNPTFKKFGSDFMRVFAKCLSLSNWVIFLSGCRTRMALIDLRLVELVEMSISLKILNRDSYPRIMTMKSITFHPFLKKEYFLWMNPCAPILTKHSKTKKAWNTNCAMSML
jgi:hypothetical protein